MRHFLAVVMLGGVLAVTASTAFADDTVNGSPRSNSALNVTRQDAFQNVNLDIPSPNANITQVYREGNLGR